MKKYFSFEVQVLDDKNVRRRFRASNYQVQTHTTLAQAAQHAPLDDTAAMQHFVVVAAKDSSSAVLRLRFGGYHEGKPPGKDAGKVLLVLPCRCC